MDPSDREDPTRSQVVINHEDHDSIRPADRENPLGWDDAGRGGNKQECPDSIEEVWSDVRSLSLRRKMEEG